VAICLIAHGLNLLAHLLFSPLAPQNYIRIRHSIFHWWGRTFARVSDMRVKIRGTPPQGSFFLVSNHVSYVDIPLLATFLDAAFIGKADLQTWPVLGWMIKSTGTVFIDRTRRKDLLRAMEAIDGYHKQGYGLVLFPEGTSTKGDRILPFKPSLLEYAATHHLPVHWATVSYRTPPDGPPASTSVCWWGDDLLVPHVKNLVRLPSFEATVHFGEEPIQSKDRKELAQRLQAAMVEVFVPMD
jgi:1-acyl-sn-glycerol-3-phosphate acyltransferase